MKKRKNFVIRDNEIAPGTHTAILFPAPNINTQVKMNIPAHIFHGKYPGPTLFVSGTIHGDELNSIEIIRRVHEKVNVAHLHGTLITIPVANVYGFVMQSRYLPDRRDLNRTFPGAKKGTLAARLASGILEFVEKSQYGIDLHTGAIGRMNIPQLRVNLDTPGARKLAIAFDAPVILDAKLRDGSLREAASQMGIPLLVYEGGEALRFNELCIRAGVDGIMNVLSYLEMHPKHRKIQKAYKPLFAKNSRWVRAGASGFVQPVGDIISKHVKKGELLAYIHDPFLLNESVKVVAPFDGIVIGQLLKPVTNDGDGLFHIASFKKIAALDETIEEYSDDYINHYSH